MTSLVAAPGANVTVWVFVRLEPSSFALTVTLCAVVDDVSVAVYVPLPLSIVAQFVVQAPGNVPSVGDSVARAADDHREGAGRRRDARVQPRERLGEGQVDVRAGAVGRRGGIDRCAAVVLEGAGREAAAEVAGRGRVGGLCQHGVGVT